MDNTEIAWWAQRAAQRRLVPKEMRKAKIHLWKRLMVRLLVQVTVGIRATVLGTEMSVGLRSKVKRLRMNTKGTATEHAASSSQSTKGTATEHATSRASLVKTGPSLRQRLIRRARGEVLDLEAMLVSETMLDADSEPETMLDADLEGFAEIPHVRDPVTLVIAIPEMIKTPPDTEDELEEISRVRAKLREEELEERRLARETPATIEVMTTPAFDAATDDIAVGPCRLRCMKNEQWMLCKMQEEIERRYRVPVSLKQLLKKYEHARRDWIDSNTQYTNWSPIGGKTWSSIIEAMSRCIAAFQKATDATEHRECQCIATKLCDYAIALARKTPADCGHEDLLALVHQFMQNRTYNLAFKHLLDRAFHAEHEDDDLFWSLVSDSPQKEECLRIIEMCMDAIRNHADRLRRQMEAYKP